MKDHKDVIELFVHSHYLELLPEQMANHLKVPFSEVAKALYLIPGINSLYDAKMAYAVRYLTQHHKEDTLREMTRAIGIKYPVGRRLCNMHHLVPIKEREKILQYVRAQEGTDTVEMMAGHLKKDAGTIRNYMVALAKERKNQARVVRAQSQQPPGEPTDAEIVANALNILQNKEQYPTWYVAAAEGFVVEYREKKRNK